MLCDLCSMVIKLPTAIQREHIETLKNIGKLATLASLPSWICHKCDENLKESKLQIKKEVKLIKSNMQDFNCSGNSKSFACVDNEDVKMKLQNMESGYPKKTGDSESFPCLGTEYTRIKVENMESADENTTSSVDAGISEDDTNLCKSCSKICYLKDLNAKFVCRECCHLEITSIKTEGTDSVENLDLADESGSYKNDEIKVEEATLSNGATSYEILHKSKFKVNKKFNVAKYIDKLGSSYTCTICPKGLSQTYTVSTRARKHVRMTHFGYRFECTECAAKYLKSIYLRKHYKIKHGIEYRNKIELTNNDLENYVRLDVSKHIKKHGDSYVCGLCPLSKCTRYRSTKYLRKHIQVCHYGHRYACPDCNEKYLTQDGLKNHCKKEHSTDDVNSLRVELTGGYTLLPISLQLLKEPIVPQPKNFNEEKIAPLIKKVDNVFICLLCHKSLQYKKIQVLRRHIRYSHYGYGYVCTECGKKYYCKPSLNNHYTIEHNIEAPKNIPLTRNFDLESNEAKKQIKKIGNHYICTICPKTKTVKYTSITGVKRHVKIMHKGYRYECSVCGAKYKREDAIRNHYRDEHNREGRIYGRLTRNFQPDLAKLYKQQQAENEMKQSSASQTGYERKFIKNMGYFYFCTLCSAEEGKSKKYKLLELVERHIKITHHGYRYQCTECGTKYSDLSNFKKHYKKKHKIAAPANIELTKLDGEDIESEEIDFDKDIEQVLSYYVCKICFEIKYKYLSQLKNHVKIMHYGYTYKCFDCDKRYSETKDFRNHYKTLHNKEAPKRISLTRRLANSTQSTATDEAPAINSKIISKRKENPTADISKKRQLIQSEIEKIETNKQIDYEKYCKRLGELYICTICYSEANSQKYKEFSSVQRHIKKHHIDYSYECTKCDAKFISSEYLKTHWKKAHKQKAPLDP